MNHFQSIFRAFGLYAPEIGISKPKAGKIMDGLLLHISSIKKNEN